VPVISSTAPLTGNGAPTVLVNALARREGAILVSAVIDLYMAGIRRARHVTSSADGMVAREAGKGHALRTDRRRRVFHALSELATRHARYWSGADADGNRIFKTKKREAKR
jgi:hypothetical protein